MAEDPITLAFRRGTIEFSLGTQGPSGIEFVIGTPGPAGIPGDMRPIAQAPDVVMSAATDGALPVWNAITQKFEVITVQRNLLIDGGNF